MIQNTILTNSKDENLKKILSDFANKADMIKIATAFFYDREIINHWLENSKQIDLLVSLRPPTDYESLKNVYSKIGINIQFLGSDFHSKFIIFYDKGQPFSCILGSSNFTTGGLLNNIETNIILSDKMYLNKIDKEFSNLWKMSFSLQTKDLDNFKRIFDNFKKRQEPSKKEQLEFEKKILNKRTNNNKKPRISKEAKQYHTFCRIVYEVKEMVNETSKQEYPNVPVYLSIDHFWHWIKIIWSKENEPTPNYNNRNITIPKLFKRYCDWDKSTNKYTEEMTKTSKTIFAKLLSENNIDKLTKNDAKKIYSSLHSGAMRTRRFGADEKFISENSIEKIRKSLKYLLYSNDDIDLRIHNLCQNTDFKLNQFKSSGTQEIIGWVTPEEYPIRNDKADEALKLLGYNLDITN